MIFETWLPYSCRFFEDYKKNENKSVVVDDILGSEDAKQAIKNSIVSLVTQPLFFLGYPNCRKIDFISNCGILGNNVYHSEFLAYTGIPSCLICVLFARLCINKPMSPR